MFHKFSNFTHSPQFAALSADPWAPEDNGDDDDGGSPDDSLGLVNALEEATSQAPWSNLDWWEDSSKKGGAASVVQVVKVVS